MRLNPNVEWRSSRTRNTRAASVTAQEWRDSDQSGEIEGTVRRADRWATPMRRVIRTSGFGAAVVAAFITAVPVTSSAAPISHVAHRGGTSVSRARLAPRYEGLSICTDASGLKLAQGRTQIVSGISYVTIIFVNAGTSNCYLNGTPFTQPVGASYTPVSPPASAYFDPSRGGYVVLDAGGGTASTSLGIANASRYYPRSSCVLRKMIGVTLRFSYPSDFFFRLGAGPVAVCRKITTTSITGVARGVVLGP